MPVIDFDPTKTNKSTSRFLVYYLEKENEGLEEEDKEPFFNQFGEEHDVEKIINELDTNNSKLGSEEDIYYSLYVAPSKRELAHINSDRDYLKLYTNKLMHEYAKNFNKGLNVNDLLYYAKVERNRYYTYKDDEVKSGKVKKGDIKKGDNTHIHIIVSRKTKSKWYKGNRIVDHNGKALTDDMTLVKKSNTAKISPMESVRGGNNYKIGKREGITRGFDRSELKRKGEMIFDRTFSYNRQIYERFEYHNLKKNHPERFLEVYGNEILINDYASIQDIEAYYKKQKFVIDTIENNINISSNNLPENFFKTLKNNGIEYNNSGFTFKNTTLSTDFVVKQLSQPLRKIFNKAFAGKIINPKSNEKDKNDDNNKEI